MDFDLEESFGILQRTPSVLAALLQDLSPEWTASNEGGQTWSAYEVVGHLVHAEETDWIPRVEAFLADKEEKTLPLFDRFIPLRQGQDKALSHLLEQFRILRGGNLSYLHAKWLTSQDLSKKGIHPVFGEVILSQLLSTWVVHDLNHLAQITRVMASQYKEAVGPWVAYLRVLRG
jgi:uncharacterized damage-inducible protein DinB